MNIRKPILLLVAALLLVACSPVISPDAVSGPPRPEPLEGRSVPGSPTVNGDFQAVESFFAGTPFLYEFALEEYSEEAHMAPGVLTYTVMMESSQAVMDGYVWCTTTRDILNENWAKIQVSMELNGRAIRRENMDLEVYEDGDIACNFLTVLLSDWPDGQHSFAVTATFTAPLNDGFGDYAAGDYSEVYTIHVGD